jgi:Domain of unknown function (DUF4404)
MDPKTLQERLAKLHSELADADNPAARQRLNEILPDPERSLPDRLERVAVQFEADHPSLAASARSLIALLSEVGI